MYMASGYIQQSSDDEDCISMSDDEMDIGIQALSAAAEREESCSDDEECDLFSAMAIDDAEEEEERAPVRHLHGAALGAPLSASMPGGAAPVSGSSIARGRGRGGGGRGPVPMAGGAPVPAPVTAESSSSRGFLGSLFGGFRSSPSSSRPAAASEEREAEAESAAVSRPRMRRSERQKRKKGFKLQSALQSRDRERKGKSHRRVAARRKVNARVIAVDLSTVGEEAALATGDPFRCGNVKCGAILSKHDTLLDIDEVVPGTEEALATTAEVPSTEEKKDDIITMEAPIEEKKDDTIAAEDDDDEDDDDDANKLWVCQFCGNHNRLEIEDEEFPSEETMDFLLEPPLSDEEKAREEKIIVFAVDTSGSMCVTTQVDGAFEMRTTAIDEDIRAFVDDRSDQFLPGQKKRGVTWVSRLALVQTAIESQVKEIGKTHSKYKIALCSFSDDIKIWGTGDASESQFVAGDKLRDMAKLKEIGANCVLRSTIDEMQDKLIEKLYTLKESGQTCLGPALVVSIAIAAKSMPSPSTVVLATDGMANIGLGTLDELSDAELDAAAEWYEEVARWALECGVTVNIVSISDAECRLENLGKVADATGGEVDQVEATTLRTRFKGILSRKVIATLTQATMLLHPLCAFAKRESDGGATKGAPKKKAIEAPILATSGGLPMDPLESKRILLAKSAMSAISETAAAEPVVGRGEGEVLELEPGAADASSKLKPVVSTVSVDKEVRDVGNVLKDDESSKLFFEFELRKERKAKYAALKEVSMQVQVAYTRLDGAKLLRVITHSVPLTSDRSKVLDSLKMDVVASHASRLAAQQCERGDYEEARATTYASGMWMARHARGADEAATLGTYMQQNMFLDAQMQTESRVEMGSAYKSKSAKRKKRSRRRGDDFSKAMYKSKKGWS